MDFTGDMFAYAGQSEHSFLSFSVNVLLLGLICSKSFRVQYATTVSGFNMQQQFMGSYLWVVSVYICVQPQFKCL